MKLNKFEILYFSFTSASYLPTTVNESDKKLNKAEKFLDLFLYTPLHSKDIEESFLAYFPNSQANCYHFVEAIKSV